MKWSDEQFAELKGLIGKGLSARQIGDRFGVSRNAILGKAYRNGLGLTHKLGPQSRPRPQSRAGRPTRRYPKSQSTHKPPGLAELEPELTTVALPLCELTDAQCHWPVDGNGAGMLFCGAAVVAGAPYCRRHHWLAHYGARP